MKDYNHSLSVLGLTPNFDEDMLKAAYRTKAKETHPDMGGNAEDFRAVNDAYTFLCTKKNVSWGDAVSFEQQVNKEMMEFLLWAIGMEGTTKKNGINYTSFRWTWTIKDE